MMNPPTILLVADTMAIVPSIVASVDLCAPLRIIAPTTAMASRAFVSDISGVWSNGETRLITSNPMKAANINTYRLLSRSDGMIAILPAFEPPGPAVRKILVAER